MAQCLSGRGLVGVTIGCALAFACGGTHPGATTSPDPAREDRVDEITLRNSATYSATTHVKGTTLLVELRAAERCVTFDSHRIEREATTAPCHGRLLSTEEVVLVSDRGEWRAVAKTDDRGVASFSLHDIPEIVLLAFILRKDDTNESAHTEMDQVLRLSIASVDRSVGVDISRAEVGPLHSLLIEDATSRVATDRAAAEADIALAQQFLAQCQADVDRGDFLAGKSCWKAHDTEWVRLEAMGGQASAHRMASDVSTCLTSMDSAVASTTACINSREISENDIIDKATCLAGVANEAVVLTCGPFDTTTGYKRRLAQLDVVKIKTRVEGKAVPILARRKRAEAEATARVAKLEAAEKAAKARCLGPDVLQVVVALRLGRDVEPRKMRDCRYRVMVGTVENTTRDGWVIVSWGSGMTVALKTSKRRADRSIFRTTGTAMYLGLAPFNMVNGGSSMIPTFRLSE